MDVSEDYGYPKKDGLEWMIWGYHYFWKHSDGSRDPPRSLSRDPTQCRLEVVTGLHVDKNMTKTTNTEDFCQNKKSSGF